MCEVMASLTRKKVIGVLGEKSPAVVGDFASSSVNQVVTVKEMGKHTEFAPFDLLTASFLPFLASVDAGI